MAEIKTILTAVDQTQAAFNSAKGNVDALGNGAEQSKGRFSALGAAAGAALGTTTGFLSDAANAAMEGALSEKQLQIAVENSGASWDKHSESLLNAVDVAQMKFAFDDGDARISLQRLTEQTGDAAAANDLLATAMDVARARGIPLEQAATMVGKAYAGNDGVLKKLGVTFDENATQSEKMAALQGKFAGQAEAFASTTSAQVDILKMKFGEWQEGLGASLGAMAPVIGMLPGLSAGFTGISTVISGSVMPAITGLGIGLGPIVLIIGAVIAVAGLLYLAWTTNFGGIQEKTQAVVGWLTGVAWPAVQSFFAQTVAKVVEFFTNWQTNFAGVLAVAQTVWSAISAVFTTVMGAIVGFVSSNWSTIQSITQGFWSVLQGLVQVGWSVISGLFNVALALLKGNWSGAWDAIKTMFSGVWDGITSILSGALTIITGALKLAWSAISTAASTTWEGIKTSIATIVGGIQTALATAWSTIQTTASTTWNTISTTASTTWNTIKTAITSKIAEASTALSTTVATIKGYFLAGWAAVEATVSTVWANIKGYITGPINEASRIVSSVIATIKSVVQSGIDLVNKLIEKINRIPGVELPNIPGLASGGITMNAGFYRVGEVGPETVYLPAGASVATARQSRGTGGGTTINIYQLPGEDARALARRVADEQERRERLKRRR